MATISHKKRACFFVLGLLIIWSVLTGVDWYFRFAHYQWGDQFKLEKWLGRAQKSNTVDTAVHDPDEQDESREEYVAPQMGGGLSRLLQVPSLRKPFEQARPAYSLSYDRLHYLNAFEYDTNVPIVVVGDSFMTCGEGMDQLFSAQLSRMVGQPVYNAAQAGRGPIYPLTVFWPSILKHRPNVLVWAFISRDIDGELFSRLPGRMGIEVPEARRVSLTQQNPFVNFLRPLSPSRLKKDLPATSAVAQSSRILQTYMEYYLLGRVCEDVVISDVALSGRKMLFVRESIDQLSRSPEARGMVAVIDSITYVHHVCEQLGIKLVVVLIPDKVDVYRNLLPKETEMRSSILWDLTVSLMSNRVETVNLLPVFQGQNQDTEVLYWYDDTHWNAKGIAVAAETVGRILLQDQE